MEYFSLGINKALQRFKKSRKLTKQILLKFHTYQAIILLFPQLAEQEELKELYTKVVDLDVLACGLLTIESNDGRTRFSFSHRSFAEFLVAKYIAEHWMDEQDIHTSRVQGFHQMYAITNPERKNKDFVLPNVSTNMHSKFAPSKFIVTILIKHILQFDTIKMLEKINFIIYRYYREVPGSGVLETSPMFVNTALLEFLDAFFSNNLNVTRNNEVDLDEFVEGATLIGILGAAACGNFPNLFQFIATLIQNDANLNKLAESVLNDTECRPDQFDHRFYNCWKLLAYAVKFGQITLNKEVVKFLVTVNQGKTNIFEKMPFWMHTPLHSAMKNMDYSCAEFYTDYFSLKNRCLLVFLLPRTKQLPLDNLNRTKDILKMLLLKDSTIVNDNLIDGMMYVSDPLATDDVHQDLLDILVEFRAPARDTTKTRMECMNQDVLATLIFACFKVHESKNK